MKIAELKDLLENFDDNQELCIVIEFPDVDNWDITTCDMRFNTRFGMPTLETVVHATDFDYPGVRDRLQEILEDFCVSHL